MIRTEKKVLFRRLVLIVSLATVFAVYYSSSVQWSSGPQSVSLKTDSLKALREFGISPRPRLFLKLADVFRRDSRAQLPLPYGINGSETLLTKVLAALGNHHVSTHFVQTCVVIGNSFAIKGRSLGRIINSYDTVIRINDAPVRGYEDDVGNKTTMRLFYPESAVADPRLHNQPRTLMVLVPFKPDDLRWLKAILCKENLKCDLYSRATYSPENMVNASFWRPPPKTWLGDTGNMRVLDPYFLRQSAERLLGSPLRGTQFAYPTTGLVAIFVALNHCRVVHVAGFGYPSSKSLEHPVHYFGNDTMKAMKGSAHDLSREARALKHLEKLGGILRLHP